MDRPAGTIEPRAMPLSQPQFSSLDDVAHIVQVALTPVFLLSSIGTLINVFSARLGRVSDQVDKIMEAAAVAGHREKVLDDRRLRQLKHRSHVLDITVILASTGGASTCGAALTLFLRRASKLRGRLRALWPVRPRAPVHHRVPRGFRLRDAARRPLSSRPRRQERKGRSGVI